MKLPEFILERRAFFGALALFALVMFIWHSQEQSKQRAIEARCNNPSYAGGTLSQLATRPDSLQQIGEAIWRASNCHKKAPA